MKKKKDSYVVRKAEFANRMHEKFGYRKKDVIQFLTDIGDMIEEIVLNGEELNISRFPIMTYRFYPGTRFKKGFRRNKNPTMTDDEFFEVEPQWVPIFKTPRNLKELRWLSTERAKQVKELYDKLKQTGNLE